MRRALASIALIGAVFGGGVACTGTGAGGNGGYVDEVQYGYYDAGHHYHPYSHPKQVRVKRSYYTSHSYQYHPHGTQHTVTVHHTTTTTTHHSNGTTTRKTTHHTTTRRTTTRRTTTRRR